MDPLHKFLFTCATFSLNSHRKFKFIMAEEELRDYDEEMDKLFTDIRKNIEAIKPRKKKPLTEAERNAVSCSRLRNMCQDFFESICIYLTENTIC